MNNIKTVVSFGNFDFERQRFGHYIDLVHELDKQSSFKFAISSKFFLFFILFCMHTIC